MKLTIAQVPSTFTIAKISDCKNWGLTNNRLLVNAKNLTKAEDNGIVSYDATSDTYNILKPSQVFLDNENMWFRLNESSNSPKFN